MCCGEVNHIFTICKNITPFKMNWLHHRIFISCDAINDLVGKFLISCLKCRSFLHPAHRHNAKTNPHHLCVTLFMDSHLCWYLQFSFKLFLLIIPRTFTGSYQLDHWFDIMIDTLLLYQLVVMIITNIIVLFWFWSSLLIHLTRPRGFAH
jgi:hypothetical protein